MAWMIRRFRLALVVWVAMIGADFVLNAAIFPAMYRENDGFFLAPGEAFARIPFGYAALLVLAVSVVELAWRLGVTTTGDGWRLGLATGASVGASWCLGLYSVATLTALGALEFALIWLVLMTVAATVAAAGLRRASLRGLLLRVVGADLLMAAFVIALQSLGLVPTLAL